MAILEVTGLKKSFGGVMAVGGVDLVVEKGGMYGVIGPNGAGKSTLFNAISGFYPCDAGRVVFKGQDITGLSPDRIVKMGMGRSFQVTKIFPKLTVYENIHSTVLFTEGCGWSMLSSTKHLAREGTRAVLAMVDLAEKADELAGTLSAGDRKRLELGIVLATKPDLILLDEPTCGMSPQETVETIALIKKINLDAGTTVLFTEHKMDFVFSMASYITVMNFGLVIASGDPETIRNDPRALDVYLGEG
ncbi:MAG: ABC transporter ATP-binding protein [Thermodesulfobacteriota bacterium]